MKEAKKNIAYLDYSHIYGGAERVLNSILRHLDRHLYQPIVIFPFPQSHHSRYTFSDKEKIYLSDRIQWWMGRDRWSHPPRGSDVMARAVFGILLAITLRKHNIKLLHVNLLRRDCMLWLLPVRAAGIKIVGHWRSASIDWLPPRRVIRLCNRVVSVSDFNRAMLEDICKRDKSLRIYDCVEQLYLSKAVDKELDKLLSCLPAEIRLIVSVGQLTPYKGHDLAIEAFARIALRYTNTVLLIAGGGSEKEHLRLNEILRKNGLGEDRVLLPAVHFSDMARLYRRAEIVLSLSHGGEAFGLVPYEAALAGRPFIGFECGAVCELVCDRVNGLLAQDNDVEDVVRRIEYLLDNPDYGLRLANVLANEVREQLNPKIMTRQLEKLYDSLL
ncbi:MAG: glycosyltransferase family 4 protein [Muribaculaceae bacterium]|nr:glycosyltransferase family 4 protein [Muribaculaceae bacterium]